MERREVSIEILVPTEGDIVVLARGSQVPSQGNLGTVVFAVCAASLPPGRFLVGVDSSGKQTLGVFLCDANFSDEVLEKLGSIAEEAAGLSLRPYLA